MTNQSEQAAIEVKPTYFFMAFLLALCKPRIQLDGGPPEQYTWGEEHRFPVTPGRHSVRVFFKYLMVPECAANDIEVDVPPGQVVTVTYKAPLIVTLKGKMAVAGTRPLTSA